MRNANFRPGIVLLLLLATLGLFAPRTRGQQVSSPAPQGRALRTIVYDGDLTALLQQLAREESVTVGFEADPQQPLPRVKIRLRDATFRDVLDAIVRAEPMYRWRQDGGLVDLYPVKGGSPLLDTVVGTFQVRDANWAEASEALVNLPEVQSAMSAARLSRREPEPGVRGLGGDAFSLRMENVTMRRALHEMAEKSGSHFWVFRQHGDGEKFFSLGNTYR